MSEHDEAIETAIGRAFGSAVTVVRRESLGGGSINRVDRIATTTGTCVLKQHARAPRHFFAAEAAGLRALAAASTALAVPAVIAVSEGVTPFLLVEDLGDGRRGPSFDDALGRGLATLHRIGARQFGFDTDNFCGLTPQPNPWTDSWVEFYRTSRLGDQAKLARDAGHVSREDAAALDGVIGRLDRWIDEPADGPSLIHGDLWSGNVHVTADGRPALIDPAVSYSHREAEFGMMTLFGGFSARVFDAYHEAFALDAGWRERNGLYQLYHLLNHVNLFGAEYRTRTMEAVLRF